MSRGGMAPGARSRNPTSCSPTAAAAIAHVSSVASAPSPRSSSLYLVCESPAAAEAWVWVWPVVLRASRRPVPSLAATAAARRRPRRTSAPARLDGLTLAIPPPSLGRGLSVAYGPEGPPATGTQVRPAAFGGA